MPATKNAPIPKSSSEHAKHAFLYLTSFGTLAFTAGALGTLLFQIINYYFPDASYNWFAFSQEPLKFAIATIFVTAPVYYFVTRVINRSIAKKDLDTDSGVRKWLTYIVLFFAVGTVIGDLITLIVYFLDGELTVRFLLKVLTILVIAGGIFLYYFTDIKNRDEKTRLRKNNMWGIFFWILVLIPFVGAFFLMENPMTTRLKRIDDNTVNDIMNVRYGIEEFYRQNEKLPSTIEDLNAPQYSYGVNVQALHDKNFRYEVTSPKNYRLCAMFERDNNKDEKDETEYYGNVTNWKHSSGNYCFELEVSVDSQRTPWMIEGGVEPVSAPTLY